jgi:hypothetical protein
MRKSGQDESKEVPFKIIKQQLHILQALGAHKGVSPSFTLLPVNDGDVINLDNYSFWNIP